MMSLQYIAGFFDGEGTINIYRQKNPKSGKTIAYNIALTITNTNKHILELIKDIIGGCLYHTKGSRKNWSDSYRLSLSSKNAYNFLVSILHYLVVKKHEAEIAIKFQKGIRHTGFRLTDEERVFREQCINDLRSCRSSHRLGVRIQTSITSHS